MEDQRLFLLDAFALIYRAYYAFIKNPIKNSKGMNTSASYGFTLFLHDLLRKEKPSHLAVVFDSPGATDRAVEHSFYKANREAMPEDIRGMIPYIKEIIKAFNIPMLELAGYEADDIIGTIAKVKEKEGHQVYMVTPDKDFAQLVSENVFIYKPSRQGNGVEILGVKEVKEKWEVDDPKQVIDILGMWGDAVDNIPGIPGVGEKTAKKLIQEYGSMENMLEHSHELKGKLRENVEAHKEQALVSKMLATIILDVPVSVEDEDLEISEPDKEKLSDLFTELEFRTLGKRIIGDEYTVNQPTNTTGQMDLFSSSDNDTGTVPNEERGKNIDNTEHTYTLVNEEKDLQKLITMLSKQKQIAFDTETTGLDALNAELVGIAFSYEKGKGFYVPFPENQEEALILIEKLKPFFENENIEKIGQNLKYDLKILANYGVSVKGKLFDTMIAHYLINPDMRHNMDILSETYLKYSPKSIEELIGKKGKNQKSMKDVPLEEVKEYAVEDADITFQLKEHFQPILEKVGTKKLFDEIEIPLVEVLAAMEREGIRLDVDFLNAMSKEMQVEIDAFQAKIFEIAGETFNLASPKQLGDILFDKLKIGGPKQKKTKTGQYATGEEILSYLAKDNEIVRYILEWRQLVKLQNTYVDALPNQVNEKTGRVHTDYMQTVAATGRLSSNNPNLQNIPIRTERGRQIRKAFIARDENYTLLAADYSQIELRIIAALSGEENMIKAFQNGEDIHRSTASKVFNVPLEEVTKEQRSNAKTVNFGIIYGVSAFGLSNQTDLSRSESAELIEAYYKTYPKLRQYIQNQIDFAREEGYVQTVLGRRRYLKDINSANAMVRGGAERNAVNAPIQGSAADIIKIAMINIHKRLEKEKWQSKMLLQVHDELVFDVHNSELEKIQPMIKEEMENAFKLDVPLIVDLGFGKDWLQAH